MKILRWGAALAVAWAALAACGLDKTVNQISARRLVVATLLSTPEIRIRPEAIAGFDAGTFTFDGGIPGDAGFAFDGGLPFDAGALLDGGLVVPPQTLAFAFFGERQGDGFQIAPVPLANTTLQFEPEGGPAWDLAPGAQGTFSLTSLDNAAFQYVPGKSWTVRATSSEVVHLAEVGSVPGHENIRQLHPDAGYLLHPAGAPLLLTRPDPPGTEDRNLGFVTVVPISPAGEQGAPTWTNVPSDAFGFVKLVAAPREWKRTEVEVPGSAFPEADRNYVILVQSAKLGGPKSENLWIGSAILAGTADVGVVRTTAP